MESSDTGGTKSMSIVGRMARERERLIGMTDEERQWRARYLKSQILAPEEPLNLPEYREQLYNPLRRFYRVPLDKVEFLLGPMIGGNAAFVVRGVIAKLIMGTIGLYCGWYYMKYNMMTWMSQTGWKSIPTRAAILPGEEGSNTLERPKNFAAYGFDKSPI